MKEKRERTLKNQLATFIPECVVFVIALVFVGLLAYNYIPGRNYIAQTEGFKVVGKLANFVLLILSCSISIGAGIALLVTSIVGRYKDRILWPHHVSFVSSFVFIATGVTCMCLVLFVK